jgi:hypothetical protein
MTIDPVCAVAIVPQTPPTPTPTPTPTPPATPPAGRDGGGGLHWLLSLVLLGLAIRQLLFGQRRR